MTEVHLKIRSLTTFLSVADPVPSATFTPLREWVSAARENFSRAGFPLETTRLATQPVSAVAPRDLTRWAADLEAACRDSGIDYVSLGAPPGDHPLANALPQAIAATSNVFGSTTIADHATGLNLRAIANTAHIIRKLADLMPDGFGDFRFAALANCPPHSPFFPVAYHDGGTPAFALATEGAPLAVEAFADARNLDEARENLIRAVQDAGQALARVADGLAGRFGYRFVGIDFSLAPFPEQASSIGTAMERLTGAQFGEHGTLFAAGFITDCLNRAQFPRVGFSGLMLPVLEDATLAARSGGYSLDSLLLYSAVCGTGLDTIPLPGDTSANAIAAILLDLATLAVKLNKPLTARLIPIAGLRAGDKTRFNFEYMTNARVLDPRARALKIFQTDSQVQFVPGRGGSEP